MAISPTDVIRSLQKVLDAIVKIPDATKEANKETQDHVYYQTRILQDAHLMIKNYHNKLIRDRNQLRRDDPYYQDKLYIYKVHIDKTHALALKMSSLLADLQNKLAGFQVFCHKSEDEISREVYKSSEYMRHLQIALKKFENRKK